MSDPVTNVEIEDVLSSIRRLVSDGDKARTRDPAPVEPEAKSSVSGPENAAEPAESSESARPDKLVLSPAFMIVDNEAAAEPDAKEDPAEEDSSQDEHGQGADAGEEAGASEEAVTRPQPFVLPDPIQSEESAPAESADVAQDQPARDIGGRASLVATIAELEAAVSKSDDDYELDGSEEPNETITWPGTVRRNFDHVEDAMTENDTPEETQAEPLAAAPAEQAARVEELVVEAEPDVENTDNRDGDVYEDDDLDGLLDTGGLNIDEEALREMVATVVREELTGPLGERITRNVRKLVRREIYRILSSKEFD